jgi:hypothetical protein
VELSVTNGGPAIPHAAILDELPPQAVVVTGEPAYCGPVPCGATVVAPYTLSLDRGLHTQGTIRTWSGRRRPRREDTRFDCSTSFGPSQIDALPSIVIHPGGSRLRGRSREVGGAGMEFFGRRSYAEGDDVRRELAGIRALGTSLRERGEQERMTDVVVVLTSAPPRTSRSAPSARSSPAAAPQRPATHFIRQNRVGLFSSAARWTISPPGDAHFRSAGLRRELSRSRLRVRGSRAPLQLLPSGSQIVSWRGTATSTCLRSTLAATRSRGRRPLSSSAAQPGRGFRLACQRTLRTTATG